MPYDSKYYLHYKNKPYRYIGLAKHSEDLKDYVIYECLYPNETSKIWIRPKDMFHSTIEQQNQQQARFAKVPFSVKQHLAVTPVLEEQIFTLYKKAFLNIDKDQFNTELIAQKNISVICFYYENICAGFIVGNEVSALKYRLGLGAVDEKFRRLGVATILLHHQIQWLKSKNYKTVEIKLGNDNKEALLFYLNAGFKIIDTEPDEAHSGIKVVLQKYLD